METNLKFSLSWLFLFLFSSSSSFSQITFEKHYSISGIQYGYSAQQLSDGGFILCGSELDTYTNLNMLLIRTNIYGDTLWTKIFGGQYDDEAYSMTVCSDGYLLCGYKKVYSRGKDVYLVKTDFNGQEIWSKTYGGNFDDIGFSVDKTNDNGFIICGESSSFGNSSQVYLLRTNSIGDTLWTKTYGGGAADAGYSVKKTSDNGFIICGEANGNQYGVYIIKTTSNGSLQWSKIVGVSTEDIGYSVEQTNDNGYIVCGKKYFVSNATTNIYLIKTNASGDTLWTKTIGDPQETEIGKSIKQTNDNGYIICGTKTSEVSKRDVYLVKTNSTGALQWSRTYGGLYWDLGNSVQKTNDNGFVVCGTYDGFTSGNFDAYLIKTNDEGIVTSINEKFDQTPVKIYPNPCTDILNVELGFPFLKMEIYNSEGNFQYYPLTNNDTHNSHLIKIDVSQFHSGLYILKIITDNLSYTKKFNIIR